MGMTFHIGEMNEQRGQIYRISGPVVTAKA